MTIKMKKLNLSALVLVVISLQSCSLFNSNCTEIEGDVVTRTIDYNSFNELEIDVPAQVTVSEDENQSVTFTGPSDLLDLLEADSGVIGSTLKLEIDGCVEYQEEELQIVIVANSLSKISVNGAADIESSSALAASTNLELVVDGAAEINLDLDNKETLDLKVDGAASVELSGNCTKQTIDVIGSGDITNRTLTTSETQINIDGAGQIQVNASEMLDVTISGAASVCYDGNPTITQEISGAGSILPCN